MWAAEYAVTIPAETESLALTSALPKDASVTASDTITAENTVAATFDFDANLTVGTLKIAGDGEIVFTKSNDAGVLTLNGQSYNKGIWTVEAGAIKQGNGHAGSGSQAWGGPFGRMSTDAYGTAGPIRRSTVLMWIVNLRSCPTRLTSSYSSPIRRRSRRSARAITTAR